MILIDVGNTRAHVYRNGQVEHMTVDEAVRRFHARRAGYINVNPHHADLLSAIAGWEDLDEKLHLKSDYPGMGVDRRALCLAYDEGIFVDAGSAITVDKVISGIYQGGFILPGLRAYARAYAAISPVLAVPPDEHIDLGILPKETKKRVSVGTMASIVSVIERVRDGLPIYITGGDGATLTAYFDDAIVDETLVFQGMEKVVSEH